MPGRLLKAGVFEQVRVVLYGVAVRPKTLLHAVTLEVGLLAGDRHLGVVNGED